MSETTTTLSAIEAPVPAPDAPPPALGGTRLAAVVFLLLVSLPPVAYAVGIRPSDAENRAPTAPPRPGAVAALDAEALAQLSDHLIDALPGRDAAIRADAWVDLEVFGTSPTDDVLVGRDDWLFLRATVEAPCRSDVQVRALGGELARAAGIAAMTGRQLRTLLAPDKATIHPERLPDVPAAAGCGQDLGAQIRRLVEVQPPEGYLPYWSHIEELRDTAGEPIYFAADTHWRTEASAVMVRAIVDAFDPTLFETAFPRRRGPVRFTGDLSLLTGLHRTESERPLVFDRPGITWELRRAGDLPEVPRDVPDIDVSVLSAVGGAVVPDRVTFLHDSFAYMTRPQLAPFFAELVMVRKHAPSVPWVAELLRSSERIVFEVVERDAWGRIVEDHLAASLAAAFRTELGGESRRFGAEEDGWAPLSLRAGDVLVIPAVATSAADSPYVLEVRRRGQPLALAALSSQRETRAGDELVFDTAGLEAPPELPLGAVEVRLRSPGGEILTPAVVDVVPTR